MGKVYIGTPPYTVEVHESQGGSDVTLTRITPLKHIVRHSTGFCWGYGGSGPADLARSILVDAMGKDALCKTCEGGGKLHWHDGEGDFEPRSRFTEDEVLDAEGSAALGSDRVVNCFECDGGIGRIPYQAFKSQVIAKFPTKQGFVLSEEEVHEWLRQHQEGSVGGVAHLPGRHDQQAHNSQEVRKK